MRQLVWGLLSLVWPETVQATDGWQPLTGDEIRQSLSSRVLLFPEGVAQDFLSDGRTIRAGTWGRWHVEEDRYCETWSGKRPICAQVDQDGLSLRFREDGGFVRTGTYGDL
jgi:hypothetical protein